MDRKDVLDMIGKQVGAKVLGVDLDKEYELGCSGCGSCCKNRQDVVISPYSLRKIAIGFDMDFMEIINKYMDPYIGDQSKSVQMVIKFKELIDSQTRCPFLFRKDGKHLCKIHDYKPGTCRIYPFGRANAGGKNKDSLRETIFFSFGDTKCSNCTETRMIKAKDWVGEKSLKIEEEWGEAVAEKYNELHKIKGYDSLIDRDEKLFLISLAYIFFSDLTIQDDEALKLYKNDDKTLNIIKDYVKVKTSK